MQTQHGPQCDICGKYILLTAMDIYQIPRLPALYCHATPDCRARFAELKIALLESMFGAAQGSLRWLLDGKPLTEQEADENLTTDINQAWQQFHAKVAA